MQPSVADHASVRLANLVGHIAVSPRSKRPVTRPSLCAAGGFSRILVANRGEIAIRVCRAAADLGLKTVAVYSEDDVFSLHTKAADEACALHGSGVPAYLDIEGLVRAAKQTSCDAVHPGYGFLSENADFARRCREEGITFIGPSVEMLALFGSKGAARAAAIEAGVPVMRGINRSVTLAEAKEFFASLESGSGMMIKALEGGGGRGSAAVTRPEDVEGAYERCRSEAMVSFGKEDVFVEELMSPARHIEVQIMADGFGGVVDLGERECSVQRRYQKILELAPAPDLAPDLRKEIIDAAVRLARHVRYNNVGTFEFLVARGQRGGAQGSRFAFIEANARLQVEHTVTEEVTGVDICGSQIRIAAGASLGDLGVMAAVNRMPRGRALQARVCLETLHADGSVRPSGGILTAYDPPGGRGVRVDGFGYSGYETSPSFDSLLAKVIVHTPSDDLPTAAARLSRALSEFRIEGAATNIPFLQSLLRHPSFLKGEAHTRFVDEHIAELVKDSAAPLPSRFLATESRVAQPGAVQGGFAGADVDSSKDPLALFAYGQSQKGSKPGASPAAVPSGLGQSTTAQGPSGTTGIPVPVQGKVQSISVAVGDTVKRGQKLAVLEAMKMEHEIKADRSGTIRKITMAVGSIVREGFPLFFLEEAGSQEASEDTVSDVDLDQVRPDLALLQERRALTLDENRPQAVERRRKTNQRTARENLADLLDPGTFVEYGGLVVARQRRRRSQKWLLENSPADGLVSGLGTVNGHLFDQERSRVMAISYDYTVFAGTQGSSNHYKQDRMFELAKRLRLPIVFFTEGGGGRPGDTEGLSGIGMDVTTFMEFPRLSGLVPLVGINSGYCFAGNTALLACCDVIIANKNSTIAMGGPAMIEGGGLGVFSPEEVGPMSFQVPNGVVDLIVEDDAAAVAAAKKYLSYFQGPVKDWKESDQRRLRHVVPENRVKIYDMRELIHTLADVDSVLELRREFGVGILTALIRIEGVPMGVIANNPHHLAGAIDSPGADKAARFLQLLDAFDLPVISLMDCPGMMVGPDVERTGLVRHCARLYNIGANLTIPMFGIVVRKAYGLGVQAMCGGSSMFPAFCVSWPTGEFYGMNIEGSVKLGYRRELEAIKDPDKRQAYFNKMVEGAYKHARAITAGQFFGIDDVIDPAETRKWICAGLRSLPPEFRPAGWTYRTSRKRPGIDTW